MPAVTPEQPKNVSSPLYEPDDPLGSPARSRIYAFEQLFSSIKNEVSKSIVGMDKELRLAIASIFAGGHVLMEGAPGLGKTTMVKAMAAAMGLDFGRIQFTPDMLPLDITGSAMRVKHANGEVSLAFNPGPVFHNIVLADEINRAGPKTQSALIEAMAERQISVDKQTHPLPSPFLVLATQNPLEFAGTYPLPETQLDRFMIKVVVGQPSKEVLSGILRRTTGQEEPEVKSVLDPAQASGIIQSMSRLTREVVLSQELEDKILKLCCSLHPNHPDGEKLDIVNKQVRQGPSPRGAQSIVMLSKVFALTSARAHVALEDIQEAAPPALLHRMILRDEALLDGSPAEIVQAAMDKVLGASTPA